MLAIFNPIIHRNFGETRNGLKENHQVTGLLVLDEVIISIIISSNIYNTIYTVLLTYMKAHDLNAVLSSLHNFLSSYNKLRIYYLHINTLIVIWNR